MKNIRSLASHKVFWFVLVALVGIGVYFLYFLWSAYKLFTSPGLPSPTIVFNSQYSHISIEHPQAWPAFDTPQGSHGDDEVIAFIGGRGIVAHPTVFIARKPFSQPTIDDVAQWGKSRLENKFLPSEKLSLGATSTPNASTFVRQYSRIAQTYFGPVTFQCMDWYTYTASNGYALSFCSDERYWPQLSSTFLQMANSFKAP